MISGGRRGFYMALGSALTLVALAAAVIEGPKLMRGGAVRAQGVPASAGVAAVAAPPDAATQAAPTAAPVQLLRPIQQPVPAQYAFRPAQPPFGQQTTISVVQFVQKNSGLICSNAIIHKSLLLHLISVVNISSVKYHATLHVL